MIKFSHNQIFIDQYLAILSIQYSSKPLLIMNMLFPLGGLFILVIILLGINENPSFFEILIIPLAFGFTPIITALTVYLARQKNKTICNSQNFIFDTEGIEISNSSFNTQLKWEGLYRATETDRFFFFYLSPRMAYFLPKYVVKNTYKLNELRSFLSTHLLCKNNIANPNDKVRLTS